MATYESLSTTLQEFFQLSNTLLEKSSTDAGTKLEESINNAVSQIRGEASIEVTSKTIYDALVAVSAEVTSLNAQYATDTELQEKIQAIKDAYEAADTVFMQTIATLATKAELATWGANLQSEIIAKTDADLVIGLDALTKMFKLASTNTPEPNAWINDMYLSAYGLNGATSLQFFTKKPVTSVELTNTVSCTFDRLTRSAENAIIRIRVDRNDGDDNISFTLKINYEDGTTKTFDMEMTVAHKDPDAFVSLGIEGKTQRRFIGQDHTLKVKEESTGIVLFGDGDADLKGKHYWGPGDDFIMAPVKLGNHLIWLQDADDPTLLSPINLIGLDYSDLRSYMFSVDRTEGYMQVRQLLPCADKIVGREGSTLEINGSITGEINGGEYGIVQNVSGPSKPGALDVVVDGVTKNTGFTQYYNYIPMDVSDPKGTKRGNNMKLWTDTFMGRQRSFCVRSASYRLQMNKDWDTFARAVELAGHSYKLVDNNGLSSYLELCNIYGRRGLTLPAVLQSTLNNGGYIPSIDELEMLAEDAAGIDSIFTSPSSKKLGVIGWCLSSTVDANGNVKLYHMTNGTTLAADPAKLEELNPWVVPMSVS